MGDLAEYGFLGGVERNFQFHMQDIDVAIAFMSARIHMIGLRLRKLGFQLGYAQEKKCKQNQVLRCRSAHRLFDEF